MVFLGTVSLPTASSICLVALLLVFFISAALHSALPFGRPHGGEPRLLAGPVNNNYKILMQPDTKAQHRVNEDEKWRRRNARVIRGPSGRRNSAFQFGLAVAHCDEDFMTWIDAVDEIFLPNRRGKPKQTRWDTAVYERCGQSVSTKHSQWQRNSGSEECTAYLQYIVDRYDELPEIIYFLQPDALGFNRAKGHQHTIFSSLKEMVAATAPLMALNAAREDSNDDAPPIGFLALGKDAGADKAKLVQPQNPNNNPVEVLELMDKRVQPAYDNATMLELVPGGCFAVRRERIYTQSLKYYNDLLTSIVDSEDGRRMCRSLESTWHIIFGEPLAIPNRARIMYHLSNDS